MIKEEEIKYYRENMNDKEIIELITRYANTLDLKENLEKGLERILQRKISTLNDVVKNKS